MASMPGSQVNPLLVPDSPPAKKKPGARINIGPTSTIPRPSRAQVLVGQSNVSGSGNAAGSSSTVNPRRSQVDRDAASRARHPVPPPAPAPTFRSGTRIVRRPSPTSVAVLRRRPEREEPLRDTDLYKDGVRPSEQLPVRSHHKCGICHLVKSHPVSYLCRHSHCYTCIRMWLEKCWTFPECVTPMHRAPFRHYGGGVYC
ncbi:hypothetical protein B0H13DRAFT_2386219 [Mycena leptocephala]|nr:hypothetical protein B0H13DRAFT_2386219 [Mycena leptocephala]